MPQLLVELRAKPEQHGGYGLAPRLSTAAPVAPGVNEPSLRAHPAASRVVGPDRVPVQVVQVPDQCVLVGAAAACDAQLVWTLCEVVELGVTGTPEVCQ